MDGKRNLPVKLVAKKNKTVELIRLSNPAPESNWLVRPFSSSSNSVDSTKQYHERNQDLGPLSMPRLQSTKVLQKSLDKLVNKPCKVIIQDEKVLKAINDRCVNQNLNFPAKQRVFSNLPTVEVNFEDVVKKAEDALNKKAKALRPSTTRKDPEPKLSDFAKAYVVEDKLAERLEIPSVESILLDSVKDDKRNELEVESLVEVEELYEDITKYSQFSFMD